MNKLNVMTFCAFAMTAVALYLLNDYPFLPPWAIFITWACFFHMDGGVNRNQAFIATITHLGLGALAAWLSAIALLNNPFTNELGTEMWGPVLIGVVIAALSRMGTMPRFCVTPAIIYGYASVFAFASMPGNFSLDILLSLSFGNAVITIVFCHFLGASAGYLNVLLIEWLSGISWLRRAQG
jgi:hypothetical protein